ncbi:MAG: hypothetical protein A2287_01810 [Candidatus Melainabacteria bacterium RIFOXYA12_FULL_32_12]|nr:MAG: hypothetical protein A2255_01635 [Candidatus Melainabacteria bacterium RIFOXYA2_FULL_32_9]OGI27704.1 MAG: hypothetical protein A2287_01810 [Candidatus Melainabacteria bacterium RIFOXYA12_FULL_32_12]
MTTINQGAATQGTNVLNLLKTTQKPPSTIFGKGETPVQKGEDAGRQIANLMRQGKSDEIANSNIKFLYYDDKLGQNSLDSGLAYSKESLKGLDQDGNNKINRDEAGIVGKIVDLDNNGEISPGENLAFTMYQDFRGVPDGMVTPDEVKLTNLSFKDPDKAKETIQKIYDDNEIGKRENKTANNQNEYIVKSGDCLWNIAQNALTNAGKPADDKAIIDLVSEIARINKIQDPNLIYPDQKLTIPVLDSQNNQEMPTNEQNKKPTILV